MDEGLEVNAKTVEEAVEQALLQLGLSRDDVEIEVLNEGSRGRFGIGSEPARVYVRPIGDGPGSEDQDVRVEPLAEAADIAEPDEPDDVAPARPRRRSAPSRTAEQPASEPLPFDHEAVARAERVLHELLRFMDVQAEVSVRPPETPGDGLGQASAVLDVAGNDDDDLGLLIGRRGATLSALQYMVNLLTTRGMEESFSVTVDVEGYRRRRERALNQLAQRAAERAVATGDVVTLEPMPANERRIVHLALADHPQVATKSIGGGDSRQVAVSLRTP